ncbi:PREDICTED: uncharacterized protein LOC109214910 [Nicotiana attenuata]|uniref:uncharacterized protein LOC109214910 n=1 Tax=Nicotiana attenuata TaxID=49451 RepID=UPI0009048C1A|nr:PREDICTED: uncharacterized protein LOC109214910 [Nicotiana attenuata]
MIVDLATREAAQLREKAARDAEEATIRDVEIGYEAERVEMGSESALGSRPVRKLGSQVQLDAMAKVLRKLTLASIHNEPHAACDICGRRYPTHECQATMEEVNAVDNYNINAIGQKHPSFLWSSHGGIANAWQQNNPRFYGQGAPGFKNKLMHQFQPQRQNQPGLEDLMKAFIVNTDERLDAHVAAIQNVEKQVGQIATILSERIPSTLPADTERNPKEMVNVVTLRSGQVFKEPTPIQKEVLSEKESREQLKIEDDEKTEKKKSKKEADKKKKEETSRREESDDVSKHMLALPFPQKLYREKLDKQFEKYLDMLRQVNVNLPFTDVVSQMPAYAKFMKEILTKKRKIEETKAVKLTEHCSAILQNKLPQKCGDPGSFTIPCSLGTLNFDKSLCDSGASINLMPLSIYRKLEKEIGEIRSVPISLQLADQTTVTPEGIVEDVLLRVDKFVFPLDFIVVNMEENKESSLFIGRPF